MAKKKVECRAFIDQPVIEMVDRLVEAGMGGSRSEVIRDILRSWAFGDSVLSYIPREDRKRYGLCLNNFRVVPEYGGRTCFIGWRRDKEHRSCKDCPEFVPYLSIVKAFRTEERA
jgi:hypothetical protein